MLLAAAHQTQRHQHLTEEDKKIAAQIQSFASTLYEKIDLDQPTIEFLRDHFYKDPTLELAYYHVFLLIHVHVLFRQVRATTT